MIHITLPDGSQRSYDQPVSGAEIAASIGKGLARDALALKLDGEVKDLATVVDRDAKIEIVTRKHPDALELLRHDAAHVLAEAVQELYPGTQITFGPATDSGFYYDFARDEPFTPEDFAVIEARMREIVDRDEQITRHVWDRTQAINYFKSIGEQYKAQIIEDLPADDVITIYRQGKVVDLCRGPHLPSTGRLGKAFKLTRLAGAYWR
ncbi:MAG: TGS domain-containing protein, partial [Hypericibacter sp.]